MPLYCGIDLYSTGSYLVILDEEDRVVRGVKVSNRLEPFLRELEPYRSRIPGIAVQSTGPCYPLRHG